MLIFIETLNISHLFDTIQKVKKMLMVKDIPDFEWKEKYYPYFTNGYPLDDDIDEYSAAYGYNWVNKGIQFVNSYHPSYGGFEDNGGLEEALDKAFQEASKVTNG